MTWMPTAKSEKGYERFRPRIPHGSRQECVEE